MTPERRFPPPWSAEEVTANCFVVTDANGQKLAYVYYENEPGQRSAAKLLTKDEARRIAAASIAGVLQRCARKVAPPTPKICRRSIDQYPLANLR